MKRMLSMLMALLLLVAPALAESATVEGDWELISLTIEGATYENLAQQGMVMTMRLEADGTGVQTVNGESYACTWTEADGRILIADSEGSMTYTLQPDGTLVGEDAVGDTMTFARVSTSVAGAWTLTAVEYEGVTISDPTTLNVEMDFLLNADGTARCPPTQARRPAPGRRAAQALPSWRKTTRPGMSRCNRTARLHWWSTA